MKNMHLLFILGLSLSTVSCSQMSIQLDPVLNNNQCGFTQQKLMYIDSDTQLKQVFKQTFNSPIKSLEKINFDSSALVLVSMGQQPTAGYSIQLNNTTATINGSSLNIDASLKKPASGTFQAQVMTSPCALYKVKKHTIKSIKLIH